MNKPFQGQFLRQPFYIRPLAAAIFANAGVAGTPKGPDADQGFLFWIKGNKKSEAFRLRLL